MSETVAQFLVTSESEGSGMSLDEYSSGSGEQISAQILNEDSGTLLVSEDKELDTNSEKHIIINLTGNDSDRNI